MHSMIVGPNWKPRVFTDAELDRIESVGHGTLEEFCAIVCRAVKNMSDEEKKELRDSWLNQVAERKRTRNSDRRFLKACGIDPDSD